MRRWEVRVGAFALLVLLRGPMLVSATWVNAGLLMLRDELIAQADFARGTYLVYGSLDQIPMTARVMQSLRRATAWDEGSPTARWALGRAALAVGDAETAAGALEPLAGRARHNPFLYHDALTAFSYGRRPEDVIALYELSPPPQRAQVISDTVALAYLDWATTGRGEGETRGLLERVKELRPGDLYANYHLWVPAQQNGDLETAAAYSEMLSDFPLEALVPGDQRLLNYAAEVIQNLVEDGLWSREKMLNVVSVMTWQHHGVEGVERLLEQLIERDPTEPDWLFYRAELYHRQDNLERAEAVYRQVLELDPNYAQAYVRAGMVAQAESSAPNPESRERLAAAAVWYERYHAMNPDDFLGLKRLAQVCTALEGAGVEGASCRQAALRVLEGKGDKQTGRQGEGERRNWRFSVSGSPASVLREALEAHTDDRRIVAELLGVPRANVELGPNLVENGDFGVWQGANPDKWTLGLYLGRSGNGGAYSAGKDDLTGDGMTARMMTLWGGVMPDDAMTYAEYVGKPFPVTDARYLISLCYSSRHSEGTGMVLLGENTRPDGTVLARTRLPDSNDRWSVIHIVVNGPSVPTVVMPLVRSWGAGQLWIGWLEIRQVDYAEAE